MPLTTNVLLEAALKYASMGFHVLPLHYPIINKTKSGQIKLFCSCHLGSECPSVGKHPQWSETFRHGVYDATLDSAQINAWWQEWPKANVGIATGSQSNLFVIDADSPIIVNDAEQRGLPHTPSVTTGNGKHAWFKHPGFPVPNKVKIDGFDFRGDSGLVVAPPSLHYSGKCYEWSVTLETPLAECPSWISQLITKSKDYTSVAPAKDATQDSAYGIGALKRAIARVTTSENGHRNDTFYKATSSLYNLVAGGELTSATVDFALTDAAEQVGLTTAEIQKTLRSAKQNGASNPRTAPKKEKLSIDLFDAQFKNTDLGNAYRIAALYGDDIHFIPQWDSWVFWNGQYWQRDNKGHVARLVHKLSKQLYQAAFELTDKDEQIKAIRHALSSQNRKAIDNTLTVLKDVLGIRVDASMFNADPWLLNVANGTLNLKTGKLQPHQQSDLITKMIDVPYDPTALTPTWISFLNTVFGNDQALIDYVQKALGYSITGDVREDCLHFAFGSGGNGKSTFFKALEKILGEYAHKSPSSMLMASKFEGIPVDVADLQGKRLVVASEVSKGVRWNEAKIKDLTGGDKLTARYMRANPFTFEPTHKLWIYGNYKPVVVGADEGIWRRLRLIPFTVKIPDAIKDTTFDDRFDAELSGILAWIVRGCYAWQKDGLTYMPETVKHATADYQAEMDKLQTFIDERCTVEKFERCLFGDLYATYVQYCKSIGEFIIDKREFKERLERKQYTVKNGAQNRLYVLGIRHYDYNELIAAHEKAKTDLTTMEIIHDA